MNETDLEQLKTSEEYKKQVFNYLTTTFNVSATRAKRLMTATEKYWQELIEAKLTPRETATGMSMNLL